jgi:tetratricopeptide (TPR) repeat protein
VVTSALVLALLVTGIAAISSMAYQSKRTLRRIAEALYAEAGTAALAGDQVKAQQSLHAAGTAGASPSQLLVLKGIIALNSGENDEAMRCAKEALERDPQSAGALALQTVACTWAGYDDLSELHLEELRRLNPGEDADRLLVAWALLASNPQEAQQLLDNSAGIQRSPVGLLVRSFTRCLEATQNRDADLGSVKQ